MLNVAIAVDSSTDYGPHAVHVIVAACEEVIGDQRCPAASELGPGMVTAWYAIVHPNDPALGSVRIEFRDRTVDGKSIVDMGAPLGQSLRVTNTGLSPTKNDLGGYSILQAESKEALAAELKGHPHFTMPEGFIEIVEIMPVPGT